MCLDGRRFPCSTWNNPTVQTGLTCRRARATCIEELEGADASLGDTEHATANAPLLAVAMAVRPPAPSYAVPLETFLESTGRSSDNGSHL